MNQAYTPAEKADQLAKIVTLEVGGFFIFIADSQPVDKVIEALSNDTYSHRHALNEYGVEIVKPLLDVINSGSYPELDVNDAPEANFIRALWQIVYETNQRAVFSRNTFNNAQFKAVAEVNRIGQQVDEAILAEFNPIMHGLIERMEVERKTNPDAIKGLFRDYWSDLDALFNNMGNFWDNACVRRHLGKFGQAAFSNHVTNSMDLRKALKSRNDFIEALKGQDLNVPIWARMVYGYHNTIVVTDGQPGAEFRTTVKAKSSDWDWDWCNTMFDVKDGKIDLDTPNRIRQGQSNAVTINIAGPGNTGKTVLMHLVIEALRSKGFNITATPMSEQNLSCLAEVDMDRIIDELKGRLNIVVNEQHTPLGIRLV